MATLAEAFSDLVTGCPTSILCLELIPLTQERSTTTSVKRIKSIVAAEDSIERSRKNVGIVEERKGQTTRFCRSQEETCSLVSGYSRRKEACIDSACAALLNAWRQQRSFHSTAYH